MSYGLVPEGFNLKRLLDIQDETAQDLKAAFGNIRTDPSSKFGIIDGILSKKLADLWEILEAVYQSFSIQAEGVSLDDKVYWAGVERLPALQSQVDVLFVGGYGTIVPVGTIVKSTATGAQFRLNSLVNLTITDGEGTLLPFKCSDYGPIAAPAGTVTILITPVSGVRSISNDSDATLGRNEETDDALRTRFINARAYLGYCRFDAIRSRLEQELQGIASLSIFENTSNSIDSDGRPPHSFEVVVDCPNSLDQAVAQKIWDVKPLGIDTYGSVSKNVTDSIGGSHVVSFSKITTIYAWIDVLLTRSTEISFPVDGIETIKRAILEFVSKVTVGNDFIVQSMYAPIYSVPGISFANVSIAVTANPGDIPSFIGTQNISVSSHNRLSFDISRISIA